MISVCDFKFGKYIRSGILAMVMASGLIPASSMAQTGGQGSLNDLELRMVESVRVEDYPAFLELLSEYEERGGTVVPDMIYYRAVALKSEGDVLGAYEEIKRFLDGAPSTHTKFRDARALLDDLSVAGPRARGLLTRLSSARSNSEQLAILYDYVYENKPYHDVRDAERRIAAIEDPLTDSTADRRFPMGLAGDPIPPGIDQMAFNQDGSVLAIGVGLGFNPTGVYITDAWDGRHLVSSPGSVDAPIYDERTSIAFSPGDDLLVMGYRDGGIGFFRYDGAGRQFRLRAPILDEIDPVLEISFSSDGKRAATVHSSRTVIVYDIEAREVIWTFQLPDQPGIGYWDGYMIALSPDGTRLLTSGPREASLWDIDKRTGLFSINADHMITDMAYASDGKSIMILDSEITFYDSVTGRSVRNHKPGKASLVGTSPSGRYFTASNGFYNYDSRGNVYDELASIRVYEPDGRLFAILDGIGHPGECRREHPHDCRAHISVVMSNDGRTVAAVATDGNMRIWRLP